MKNNKKTHYGMELIIDLHGCDMGANVSKKKAARFFTEVCNMTKMQKHGKPLWWTQKSDMPFWHGTSALQFIKTSSIVLHALPKMRACYINIFTCKPFLPEPVVLFAKKFWNAKKVATKRLIIRK